MVFKLSVIYPWSAPPWNRTVRTPGGRRPGAPFSIPHLIPMVIHKKMSFGHCGNRRYTRLNQNKQKKPIKNKKAVIHSFCQTKKNKKIQSMYKKKQHSVLWPVNTSQEERKKKGMQSFCQSRGEKQKSVRLPVKKRQKKNGIQSWCQVKKNFHSVLMPGKSLKKDPNLVPVVHPQVFRAALACISL